MDAAGDVATGGDVTACEDSVSSTLRTNCCFYFYCRAEASCHRRLARWPGGPLSPCPQASDGANDCSAPSTSTPQMERPNYQRSGVGGDAAAVAAGGGDAAADVAAENVEESAGSNAAGGG